jgi:hypothetical protein
MTLSTDICNALINTKFTATVRGGQVTGGLGTDDFQITFDILLTRQLLLYIPSENLHFNLHRCISSQSFQWYRKLGHTHLDQTNHTLTGYETAIMM